MVSSSDGVRRLLARVVGVLLGLFVAIGPFRVFLGDEAFETLGEDIATIGSGVGAGGCKVEVFLVLEGFGGGPVEYPIGLPLIELLDTFGDDHDSSENGSDGGRNLQGGNYRHCGSDDEFGEFEALVRPLRSHALAVVPVDLIFQALPHRIVSRRVVRKLVAAVVRAGCAGRGWLIAHARFLSLCLTMCDATAHATLKGGSE